MKKDKNGIVTDIPFLHKSCNEVNIADKIQMRDISNKLMNMYNKLNGKCLGLSAIQLGILDCAALIRFDKSKMPTVMFNPKVLKTFGKRKSNEGCISEGDVRYIVTRPILLKIEYYDVNGNKIVSWYNYKYARIIMHEIDHMHGILLQDKGERANVVSNA